MPGATVTLHNTGTGFSRSVVTDAHGEYTAPSIPTGAYSVTAEITGFKKVSKTNVLVGVDQKVRIDIALEIGAMEEVVEIQAETPLLNTSSSDLGTTVVEEQIKTLPLNGRNFVSLTRTVPGVLRGIPGANIDGAGSLAWRASASFSAMGQRPRDNNYMLDGVDNNETWLQTVVIFPSVDALEEFKLQTSTYSAEFGRSLGGVVNLQLKSGTNQFHGSVFEFLRNDAFDANNWFANRANTAKADFKQHQFGATTRRPDHQGQDVLLRRLPGPAHRRAARRYLSTVPTAKMRNGDFSELNRVIYDPTTGQPFPGNIIPQSRQDPASRNILTQLYPEPNTAGTTAASGQQINNYLINPTLERQDNQFDVKVDHRLTTNNRFFVRYSYQKTHRFLPATLEHGDAGATFGAGDGNIKAQSVTFNDTHTFSPNTLNEFRFGWNSIKFLHDTARLRREPALGDGHPGHQHQRRHLGMTQMTFQNISNLGQNGNQPLITNQNDFQIFDNVTWIKGRHTFKLGGSVTFRSREILNADNDRRQLRLQQQHDLELRGHGRGLHGQLEHGLRRRELPARLRDHQDPQHVRRRDLHREAARSGRSTCRTTSASAASSRSTSACATTSTCPGSRSRTGSRTSTSRPARSWWPRTTPRSRASTSGAISRPTPRATSHRASASPTT